MKTQIILISSQSLACGCLLAESVVSNQMRPGAPLVMITERPFWTDPVKIAVEIRRAEGPSLNPLLLRQSAYERANPNQPWYARFEKRRRRH